MISATASVGGVCAMRSGMMKQTGGVTLASASNSSGKGRCSRKTMLRSSGAARSSVRAISTWPIGSRAAQRRMEATQSAARTGSPSWNLSPSRRRIVTRRPSFSTAWPSAIWGWAA